MLVSCTYPKLAVIINLSKMILDREQCDKTKVHCNPALGYIILRKIKK